MSAAPPQSQTVLVRNFRCNSCGNQLEIPSNSKAPVRCPFCRTSCIIDGVIRNAEIAAKENINSGVHLFATPATLHCQLVSILTPHHLLLDFEKIEVVREERYCVPAYCFYCNGTASFTYEKGVERTETYTAFDEIQEKTHIEWYSGS
jgi:hypothetical protein